MAKKHEVLDKEKEQEMQKKYVQLHMFREQFKAMAEERSVLENRLSELQFTMDTLQKLDGVKSGEEIWSTIGSGAFLHNTMKDTESVLITVGSGVVVRKTRKEALETLQSRMDELKSVGGQMDTELQKYALQIQRIETQLQSMVERQD